MTPLFYQWTVKFDPLNFIGLRAEYKVGKKIKGKRLISIRKKNTRRDIIVPCLF